LEVPDERMLLSQESQIGPKPFASISFRMVWCSILSKAFFEVKFKNYDFYLGMMAPPILGS
jgi:hypothetical protein